MRLLRHPGERADRRRRAAAARMDYGEFGAHQKYLRRIVDPHEHHDESPGRFIATTKWLPTFPTIGFSMNLLSIHGFS